MKHYLRFLFSLIIISLFCACGKKDEPQLPETKTRFAVLVYMVASNSLGASGYDAADIKEMENAAGQIPDGTRWLVYHAPSNSDQPVLKELNSDGTWTALKEYTPRQSATPERLSEVIRDFREICNPEADGIVFWSHASGWLEDGAVNAVPGMQKSFGVDFGTRMNLTAMAPVLEKAPFRFLYFDACFMGTVEVVYELRKSADYIVASPAEVPAAGMPYQHNLPLLLDGTIESLKEAAVNTFNLYDSQSDPEMRTCTMTVVRTDALERLAAATAPIYLKTPLAHPLTTATNYRGTTVTGYSLDLGEYVTALCDEHGIPDSERTEFESALNSAVIYCAATPRLWNSWPLNNPTGLATYVFNDPAKYDTKGYDRLQWAQDVVKPRLDL
ncbi:MAG: hypothetical protein K2M19_04145 [Muribaculaceae bacterium]|nr:hypothetical protein [Muribaculaceae bacterium]